MQSESITEEPTLQLGWKSSENRRAALVDRLASLFHCKIDAVRRAFELGSLFVAKRLGGDDKQAIGADLAGGEERVAHGLSALRRELTQVIVADFCVLHHQLFHLRNRQILR